MLHGQRLFVVIPAYNTGPRVLGVIRSLPDVVDGAVVVDDASGPETRALLDDLTDPRVTVCTHRENRGVGAALATGYARALDLGADLVAVMAGDGQMHPDDLVALATPVALGDADYSKGDRLAHPGCAREMPRARRLGNTVLSALTRAATGLWHVNDSQCGYTVVSRRVLVHLDTSRMWTRYGYPNHLLAALAHAGFRVRDVTVRPVYAGERSGIRLRDALLVIPRILLAVAWARARNRPAGALGLPLDLRRSPEFVS
jgi:glycosyltransferase involved in cell wall biosynthesis